MLRSDRNEQIFESVSVLAFHSEHSAEMDMIMLPENHVLCVFETMENRLHGDDGEGIRMLQVSCVTELVTRKVSGSPVQTHLQPLSLFHFSIFASLDSLRRRQRFSHNSYLRGKCQ